MLRETGPTLAGRRLERAGWRAPDVRLRGRLTSALAGVAVGVVSNHAAISVATWRR